MRTSTHTVGADWPEIIVLLCVALLFFAIGGMLVAVFYIGPWEWRNPLNAVVLFLGTCVVGMLVEAWKYRTKTTVTTHASNCLDDAALQKKAQDGTLTLDDLNQVVEEHGSLSRSPKDNP